MTEELKPGIYGHHKGGRYEVLGTGKFGTAADPAIFFGLARYTEPREGEAPPEVEVHRRGDAFVFECPDVNSCLDHVVYRQLYASTEFDHGSLWVRPLEMFFETVEHEGAEVPRFHFIRPSQDDNE